MSGTNGNEQKSEQPSQETPYTRDTVSLLDIIYVLARHKAFIFFSTLIAAVLVVVFSVYTLMMPADSSYNPLPNMFAPEVQVLLQQQGGGQDALSNLLSQDSGIGSLANMAGISTSITKSADLAQALLKGRNILDQVANEFSLVDRWGIEENPKTGARTKLRETIKMEYTTETGILRINFESTDKEFATKIVNRLVALLEKRFKELTTDRLTQKMTFLENRIATVEKDLKEAQNRLIQFQKRTGLYSMEIQSASQIRMIAEQEAALYKKQLERQMLLEYLEPDAPQVKKLDNEIGVQKRFIHELKHGLSSFSYEGVTPGEIPELSTQVAELQMDLELQKAIYEMLRKSYETAKIEEMDTTSSFQIIERAEVPEVKAGPSRSILCIIVTLAAFFLSIFIAFIKEYIENVKHDPEESEKLEGIKQELSVKKRR